MLDMEHGSYTFSQVAEVCQVARAVEIGSFARVPDLRKGYVSRALYCGATSVMVPSVESIEQVQSLVGWTKFAPVGRRGLGRSGGHTDFKTLGGETRAFMERANNETIYIAQIET